MSCRIKFFDLYLDFGLSNCILAIMEGEELCEFSDEELAKLDQVVDNLAKIEQHSPMKSENTCNKSTQQHLQTGPLEQHGDSQPVDTSNEATNKTEPVKRKVITPEQLELAAAVFDDDDDHHEPSLEHLDCLISRFKHDRFREKQWEIIRTVMIERRDVCAVMATGYGKSLCFQVILFFVHFLSWEKFQIWFRCRQ